MKSLAKIDLESFIHFLSISNEVKNYSISPIPIEHIANYLSFYNFLRDEFFSETKHMTMPYLSFPLGMLFFRGSSSCQFRACTPKYPSPLLSIDDDETIHQYFGKPPNNDLINDIQPQSPLYLGGYHDFKKFPQKAAYDHLLEEVISGLKSGMLHEKDAPILLRERIFSILFHEPSMWLKDDDLAMKHYYELLGYKNAHEVGETKVSDILLSLSRIEKLFIERVARNDQYSRIYSLRVNELFAVRFSLLQMDPDIKLGNLCYSVEELWQGLDMDLEFNKKIFVTLVPIIIDCCKIVYRINFPRLMQYSNLLQHINNSKYIEISKNKSYSDFLTISYIFDSDDWNVNLGRNYSQSASDPKFNCIRFDWRTNQTFINTEIKENEVTEMKAEKEAHENLGNAIVINTVYPSRTPILDQVYQLIVFDLIKTLQYEKHYWSQSINLVNDQYIESISRAYLSFISRQKSHGQ